MIEIVFRRYIKNLLIIWLLGYLNNLIFGNKFNIWVEFVLGKYYFKFNLITIVILSNLFLIFDFIIFFFFVLNIKDNKLDVLKLHESIEKMNEIWKKEPYEGKSNDILKYQLEIKKIMKLNKYYKIKKQNIIPYYIKYNNYYNISIMFLWSSLCFFYYVNKYKQNNLLDYTIENLFIMLLIFQITNLKNVLISFIKDTNNDSIKNLIVKLLNILEYYLLINLLLKFLMRKEKEYYLFYLFIYNIFIILIFKYMTKFIIFKNFLILYIRIMISL